MRKQKNLNLTFSPGIYAKLADLTKERGMGVQELIRWVIGDYIIFSSPRLFPITASPMPLPPVDNTAKRITKLTELMLKNQVSQGIYKCPNCTMPLNIGAIEEGNCQNCGAEI